MKYPNKMWVVTVNKKGNELGDGHWVIIPEPKEYRSFGLRYIRRYISKLMFTRKSLVISTIDQKVAISLFKSKDYPVVALFVDRLLKPEQEKNIREFFKRINVQPFQDYLAQNGERKNAVRILSYRLPKDVNFVSNLSVNIFKQIYGVNYNRGLQFSLREIHEDL